MATKKHTAPLRAAQPAIVLHSNAGDWAVWAASALGALPGWVTVLGFRFDSGAAVPVHHAVTWSEAGDERELEQRWLVAWAYRTPVPMEWAAGGITTRLVRSVNVGPLERRVREYLVEEGRLLPAGLVTMPTRRRGNAPRGVDLAALAARYVDLLNHQEPHPVTRLAEQEHVSRNTLSHRLWIARERGLLTSPGGRGKAGGDLTDEARRLLAQEES